MSRAAVLVHADGDDGAAALPAPREPSKQRPRGGATPVLPAPASPGRFIRARTARQVSSDTMRRSSRVTRCHSDSGRIRRRYAEERRAKTVECLEAVPGYGIRQVQPDDDISNIADRRRGVGQDFRNCGGASVGRLPYGISLVRVYLCGRVRGCPRPSFCRGGLLAFLHCTYGRRDVRNPPQSLAGLSLCNSQVVKDLEIHP